MKKIAIFTLVALLFTGCSQTKGKVVEKNSTQVKTQLENKESMILVIGATTCPACIAYDEVLHEVVKNYETEIIEIYIDKEKVETVTVDGKDTQVRVELVKLFDVIGEITATPTTFFIVDGEIMYRKEGMIDYRSFKDQLLKYFPTTK